MHFAYPLPWWLALALAAAIGAAAFFQYRRPLAPLTRGQRVTLVALRAVVLAAIVLFLFRPMIILPPAASQDALVPVLIDVSRSMRLVDADGQSRVARAAAIVKTDLMPALTRQFQTELYSVGDGLAPAAPAALDRLSADARRTDLAGALASIRERYRGQRVAGIVLLSDGGDTSRAGGAGQAGGAGGEGGPPVFAIGIGSPDGPRDREVLGITAGDPHLDQASVDLHVTAVSFGFGRTPFPLRVLANGRMFDTRRIVPPADGSPIDEVFTVSPDPLNATVYSAEIPVDDAEAVAENNSRAVLVSPAGRKRRVLVVEGAPGFEHSFIKRALANDPGLEVDSVTRKGRNAENQDTFFVQAGAGRSATLTTGFPQRRQDLFAYDALVIANVETDFFTRAQLATAADFVAERGGGLLVLGGRSFAKRGLSGTPLEEALPVEVNDRLGGLVRTSLASGSMPAHNKVMLTAEGEAHPIMRIGSSPDETRKLWAALPPLAASATLGGPRPGATILALTTAPGGGVFPVVAVQRYGQGRSMIFAGEASWRWKMMVASSDRAHEFFWRQAARWLASPSPDPVAITVPDAPEPGDAISIDVDARDATFAPVPDATIDATLTLPGGAAQPLKLRHADATSGRFTAAIRPEHPGLYRIRAEAHRGAASLGTADRWMHVGGADREFADPRLNEGFLRRVARTSGGRYVRAAEASRIPAFLTSAIPQNAAPERRDLWHEPWAFALIAILLSAEWILRRRWGLR
ncbi:MAG: hypothetical protein AUH43_02745 [Acidobacteria bacterium 13_1_40CM_65_14]|nr:MAG: hypothetical protein AUH43_02745 [Acidobacteria bacterium 13_1_40CM_65_14]OLD20254.1 MAG: hypothetical protein AUJ01_04470 [Acidobacteria bacterium 13_1_40CM_3_65_5]